MVIYKAFFKVIKKQLSHILIYVVVFLALAITLAKTNTSFIESDFTESKIKMTFINQDEDSWLVKGLEDFLEEKAYMVDIPNNKKELQDALFFREVEYILKVPEGFTKAFIEEGFGDLEKMSVHESSSGIFMDHLINKYLKTVKLYTSNVKEYSEEQILNLVKEDLAQSTEVTISGRVDDTKNNNRRANYFNYMSYAIFSVLILGVCSVMLVFNKTDIRKRNLCAPMPLRKSNFQLILGLISFAIFTWGLMLLPSGFMYGKFMLTVRGLLFMLNALAFTLSALSISYFISHFITNRNAMSAVANVISLGSCFISGVFVPQEFLGERVLKIASLTPNYWYVKTNDIIANLDLSNQENIKMIVMNILIILLFALAMLAISLAVIKQKRVSYE